VTGASPAPGIVGLNLHSHLEGSVRPGTAAEIADGLGIRPPAGGWETALRMSQPGTLTTFLEHVAHAYPLFWSREAIYRIVSEAVEDAAADGTAYLELRFGPATHVSPSLPLSAVVTAATNAVRDAADRGIRAGLIVCALRHHDADNNREVARLAAEFAGRGVVGFDVAGDERLFASLEPMREPFAIAAAAGLGLTAHAAEAGPASAVREAVETLGVRRIGHGSRAAEDTELLRWAVESGVCFEVCPTSNVLTGAAPSYTEHPVKAFVRAGCDVVVGDDDPTTTGSRLGREFERLADAAGLSPEAVRHIHQTSIDRVFCEPSDREAIAAKARMLLDRG
jgi:adenosine deaminase